MHDGLYSLLSNLIESLNEVQVMCKVIQVLRKFSFADS